MSSRHIIKQIWHIGFVPYQFLLHSEKWYCTRRLYIIYMVTLLCVCMYLIYMFIDKFMGDQTMKSERKSNSNAQK